MIGNLLIVVILAFTGGFCIAWAVGMSEIDLLAAHIRRIREDQGWGVVGPLPEGVEVYRGNAEADNALLVAQLKAYDEALKEAEVRTK